MTLREQRIEFHRELQEVNDTLIRAALGIVDAVPRLTRAFLEADRDCIAEARSLADEVADACRRVEDRGFVLIAREAPVGTDLRRIVSLLRLVTDVDRAASLLRHVPESLDLLDPRELPEPVREVIAEMGRWAAEIYRRGVEAWRTDDSLAVNELEELDSRVDELQRTLLERAAADEEVAPTANLALGLVARYYERIADHGVAFARDAAFVATGTRTGG